MNKKIIRAFIPIVIFTFIPILFITTNGKIKSSKVDSIKEFQFIKDDSNAILEKLNKLSLREKIAQMVISSVIPGDININSSEFTKLKKLCTETKVGGFIFFKGSSKDYATLSNKLQELSETPLLISADFERGTGMRVIDGTLFPNNMAIGATYNTDLAYKMGLIIASESRAMGIQQDYAPDCDVNNNPNNPIINVRSFGEDPDLVSKMSLSEIKGLQENKVIATAKHFPGHGDTEIDSHKDLPVLNFSMDRLNQIELVPFKNAISKNVMSIMIAHLSFPELEHNPKIPASLSANIVQTLLIDNLGFNGLIVTDALNMKGITKYYNTEQVALMCVNAGIDLILMPNDEEKTVNAIEKAVLNNEISEERINRSVFKILYAKEWLGLFENKYVDEITLSSKINTKESNDLAQQIADESITLVKDDNNMVPIKNKNSKILCINIFDDKASANSDYFTNKLKEEFSNIETVDIEGEPTEETAEKYSNYASNFNEIIVGIFIKVRYGTGKIGLSSSQLNFINKLTSAANKTIIISFGNPYILKDFPSTPNYICAYGDANVSIVAVLKAIKGEIHFKGKLPVTINSDYKIGSGIQK